MGGWQARRLCPGLITVPPRFDAYTEASRAVFEVFDDMCRVVEGLSIDEAFLDVRGMRRIAGSPRDIAARLRRRVRAEVGLPITVGVARTKFLAKVASGVAKPDGLLVVAPAGGARVPASAPGREAVGRGRQERGQAARARHHRRSGRWPSCRRRCWSSLLGKAAGRKLHALAHNRDPRRVVRGTRRRSIGSQRALGRRGPRTLAALDPTVLAIIDRLGRRLRAAGGVCRTIVLRMRFDDFARATRSVTLPAATAHTPTLLAAARELLVASMPLVARARADADRLLADESDGHRWHPARPAARSPARGPSSRRGFPDGTRHSTWPWTRCASASARARSPAPCCWGATPASRCRICRIDRPSSARRGGGGHSYAGWLSPSPRRPSGRPRCASGTAGPARSAGSR